MCTRPYACPFPFCWRGVTPESSQKVSPCVTPSAMGCPLDLGPTTRRDFESAYCFVPGRMPALFRSVGGAPSDYFHPWFTRIVHTGHKG
jgi:hypothetical protein